MQTNFTDCNAHTVVQWSSEAHRSVYSIAIATNGVEVDLRLTAGVTRLSWVELNVVVVGDTSCWLAATGRNLHHHDASSDWNNILTPLTLRSTTVEVQSSS